MARPTTEIIQLLRKTAESIQNSTDYQWGHMGACNCGHLAQNITMKSKAEIHMSAMQGIGDWNDQLNDFCPGSGLPFDQIVQEMLEIGFSVKDLMSLEYLNDKKVLELLPTGIHLVKNKREDVMTYLLTWADMLEEEMHESIKAEEKALIYI
jgi:hypothetical protein